MTVEARTLGSAQIPTRSDAKERAERVLGSPKSTTTDDSEQRRRNCSYPLRFERKWFSVLKWNHNRTISRNRAPATVLSGQQTAVDRPLAVLGLKRSVGLLPYFLPACLAVAQSNMILTTPSRLARELEKVAAVRVIKAPAELAGFKYEMTWHARLAADPAHAWFRDQIREVARELQWRGVP
jgi:DNA-binding transcriptional LysR family regulator